MTRRPEFDPTGSYRRAAGIVERRIDDAAFLADADGKAIYHLNATGAALWRLLAEPTGQRAAARTFHQAFPERGREDIEAEIAALLSKLLAHDLIVRAD